MKFRWKKRYTFYLLLTVAILLFVTAALASRIFYVVDSGQAGVLYRFFWGTDVKNVYHEGLVLVFPWNRVYIYDIREQELTQSVQVLSFNGLNIEVVFSFRYRPDAEKLPLLHQQLGPSYVDKVVRPLLISAVREVIGNYRPEELYTTHAATIQQEIQRLCQRSIEEFNIRFSQVLIQDINLPDKVTVAIEEKLVLQQEAESYDFRLLTAERERLRKTVEAEGIRQQNRIISEELSDKLLQYQHIQSLRDLSLSQNTKVLILEGGSHQPVSLPLFLDSSAPSSGSSSAEGKRSSPGTGPRPPLPTAEASEASAAGASGSSSTEAGTKESSPSGGTDRGTSGSLDSDASSKQSSREPMVGAGSDAEKTEASARPEKTDGKSLEPSRSVAPGKNKPGPSDSTRRGGSSR